jgi:uncharacterized protein
LFDRLRRLMPERETLANNRWLRWLGPSLLHPRLWHLNRHGVAKGAAIGVFFAFVTPIAQIPLSAGLSVLLRANVPAAVVGTLVNTPPTFGPVYYAAWRVGSWVLDEPMDEAHTPAALGAPERAASAPQGWWARTAGTLQEVGKPLFLGALIFSVIGSVLAYGLVNGMWVWRVRAKRKKRLGARR